jgi:hypothetical protein
MKHKSPEYKLSAVNYYLNHNIGYDNTCKITKPQVNTALEILKQNEQLTMNELAIDIKKM